MCGGRRTLNARRSVTLASMQESATSAPGLPIQKVVQAGMLPLLLVRHARTADNAARILVGRRDVPLDTVGRQQAERLLQQLLLLDPAAVYVSPLQRAIQTVQGLGDAVRVPALIEVHHGVIEGLQERTARARHGAFLERWGRDPEHSVIPGGESLGQAVARALPALEAIAAAHVPPRPVVVCCHQMIIAGLLCAIQGFSLARYRDLTSRNTGINVLGWSAGRWRVFGTDDVSHLGQEG